MKSSFKFIMMLWFEGWVLGKPGGAPGCKSTAVRKMGGGNAPDATDSAFGCTLVVDRDTYSPGSTITCTMTCTDLEQLNGVLIYAEPFDTQDGDDTPRLGEWTITDGWQAGNCNCQNGGQNCGLTHIDSNPKNVADLTFALTLPEDYGQIVIQTGIATGPQAVQVLEPVRIQGQGGDIEPVGVVPGQGRNCQCQKVKKCKSWKSRSYGGGNGTMSGSGYDGNGTSGSGRSSQDPNAYIGSQSGTSGSANQSGNYTGQSASDVPSANDIIGGSNEVDDSGGSSGSSSGIVSSDSGNASGSGSVSALSDSPGQEVKPFLSLMIVALLSLMM